MGLVCPLGAVQADLLTLNATAPGPAGTAGPGARRTYQAPLAGLPSGTMVDIGGTPWLVYGGGLLAWTPGGYRDRRACGPATAVTVITPRATVATLAAGYRPVVHPTVRAGGSQPT